MNAASLSELAIVAVILLDLALAASGSLAVCIRLAAAQGVITAVLPLLAGSWPVHPRTLVFSIAVAALKGVVFPWLLTRARLVAKVSKDTGPVIGYPASIMLCILAFAAAAWLGTRLPLPTARIAWIVPASLATIFTGFLLIITRAKAITQVLGYLVMENGIYIFGLALFVEQPMMVEMAILLDIFVAVFVMGITIFHISKEFDHIDTAELSELSDWHPESRRAQ